MTTASIDRKVVLMQYLEEFKTFSYAFELCDLLIKTQNVPEEFRDEHNKHIFSYIKKIITDGHAEKLVKKICNALDVPKKSVGKAKQLLEVLLKYDEYKEKRCEYLNHLKRILESFVKVFLFSDVSVSLAPWGEESYKIKLDVLKEYLVSHGRSCINNLLLSIFHCILDKIDFSYTEKKIIGETFIEAAQILDAHIKAESLNFYYRLTIANLKRRSALEFIKDLFYELKIAKEDIAKLDAVIQFSDNISIKMGCNVMNDSEEDSSDTLFDFQKYSYDAMCDSDAMLDGCGENYFADYCDSIETFNSSGACDVPKEHIWWQKYKDTYFK